MKTGCYKPLVPCWLVTQTQRHTHTQPPPFVTIADKLLSAIQKQLHTHTFTHTYTTNSKGRDLFFLLVTREHVWCKIKWVRSAWSVTGGFSIFCLRVLEKNEEKEGICKRQVEGFFFFYPHINFCRSNIIKTLSAEQNALRLCIYSLQVYGIIKPQQQGLYSSEDDSSCLQFIQMTATVCFSNSGGRSDLLNWLLRGGVTSSSH